MPEPRTFTADEIERAKSMRLIGMSWGAIGRAIGCNDDTIRRALDDGFRLRRNAIQAKQQQSRRNTAKAAEAEKDRIGARAYKPSLLGPDDYTGRMSIAAAASSGRARVTRFE